MSDDATTTGGGLLQGQPRPCPEEELGGPGDTGVDQQILVEGGGGCSTTPTMGSWVFLFVVLKLLVGSALAADVQNLQPLGTDFVSIRSATIGPSLSSRFSLGGDLALVPLAARNVVTDERTALVPTFWTARVGASLALGDYLRLGAVVPYHVATGEQTQFGPGDVLVQLTAGEEGVPVAVVVEMERRVKGGVEGFATNAVVGGLTGRMGAFGWQLLARLQPNDEIFGAPTSSRLEPALGVGGAVHPKIDASVELFGALPLGAPETLYDVPLEVLTSARLKLPHGMSVRLAGAVGLTAGLGAPQSRVLVNVDVERPAPADVDGDGRVAPRDLCPQRAEDRDGYQDWDGCPDEDNDADGLLDVDDACPDLAEVYNGVADEDGCPDALARWEVEVMGPETWTVSEGGTVHRGLAGERVSFAGAPERRTVLAEAVGFVSQAFTAELVGGHTVHTRLQLEPVQLGTLVVVVRDPQGELVQDGTVTVEGVEHAFRGGGLTLTESVGVVDLRVGSDGFEDQSATVEIRQGAVSTHAVTLERPVVRLDGNQVSSSDSPLFELNADDLTSTVALDELAQWLQDHPEVVLLRVEGHADPLGSSAYNYDLSVRRAEGVHAILVARGVDPARLQVIGSGEAWSGDGPVRQVAFTVIVWAD